MLETKTILLQNYEVAPPEGLWNAIASELDELAEVQAFAAIAAEAVELPMFEHGAIWDNIATQLDETLESTDTAPVVVAPTPVKPIVPLKSNRKWWYAAAAVITGIGLWIGINQYNTAEQLNTLTQQDKPKDSSYNHQHTHNTPTDSTSTNTEHLAQNGASSNSATRGKHPSSIINYKPVPQKAIINLHHFDIEDENNFFVVLANYVIPQENEYGMIEVKLDEQSSIHISPRMRMFMKSLYEKRGRRKNKPTRAARRSYRKLRTWKKSTETNFVEKNKNLADPFELAEFLNKKS